jgi:hypothetical protein
VPNQIGAALLDGAREAFTAGMQTAAGVSAAGAIGRQDEQGAGDDVVARVGEQG